MTGPSLDVVVVGASLVGLLTALRLRADGARVAVLEAGPPPATDDAAGPEPLELAALPDTLAQDLSDLVLAAHGDRIVVDERAMWRRVAAEAEAVELDLRWSHTAMGAIVAEGAVRGMRTSHGRTMADRVVIAAGAGTAAILPALGLQLPIIPEHVAWGSAPGGRHDATYRDLGLAPRSVQAAFVLDGWQGRAVVGRYASFGTPGMHADAVARRYLAEVLTLAGSAGRLERWWWRSRAHVSADHLPAVGPIGPATGLILAVPHGGAGNGLAIEIARIAARVVAGGDPPDAWRADRFPQPAPGGRKVVAA